jgi:hypothetical protein
VRSGIFIGSLLATAVVGAALAIHGVILHKYSLWSHHVHGPDYLWFCAACNVLYAVSAVLAKLGKLISPKWFFPVGIAVILFHVLSISHIAIARAYFDGIDVTASAENGAPLSILYLMRDQVEADSRFGDCSYSDGTISCQLPRVHVKFAELRQASPLDFDGVCWNHEMSRLRSARLIDEVTATARASLFCSIFCGMLASWKATVTGIITSLSISLVSILGQVMFSAWLILRRR